MCLARHFPPIFIVSFKFLKTLECRHILHYGDKFLDRWTGWLLVAPARRKFDQFVLRIWISSPEQKAFLEARIQAIMRIKAAYNGYNITIPFPICTLDFGIKGGLTLKEMLGTNVS